MRKALSKNAEMFAKKTKRRRKRAHIERHSRNPVAQVDTLEVKLIPGKKSDRRHQNHGR
jgi:hypothetical protein